MHTKLLMLTSFIVPFYILLHRDFKLLLCERVLTTLILVNITTKAALLELFDLVVI